MKYSQSKISEARSFLLPLCPPGTTIYTRLNHASRSGLSRSLDLFVIKDNEPLRITYSACVLLSERLDRYEGLPMTGCGMDMGFAAVYALSRHLYPSGFGLESIDTPKIRPSTLEEAAILLSQGHVFHGRNGSTSGWDSDGGYALSQRWL